MRDTMETQRCQSLFEQDCERARQADIAKALQKRRVAEDNMMIMQNRKRQEQTSHVQECMEQQTNTHKAKITYSTMIR